MRMLCKTAFAVVAVALIVSPAMAQRQGFGRFGGGSQVGLLSQESVQKELKLTEDQIAKAKEFQAKQRESSAAKPQNREELQKRIEESRKAGDKFIADTLKPEQAKRLKQISWQRSGTAALSSEEVVKELKITDEQKQKLEAIQKESFAAFREGFKPGGGKPDAEALKKFEEARKATSEKLLNVLNDQQKAKWKELQGEPFKGEIVRPSRKPAGA